MKYISLLLLLVSSLASATTTTIKDSLADYYMRVNADGSINTDAACTQSGAWSVTVPGVATEATLSSFKSANHTDVMQLDTDLLAFKTANHTDLGVIAGKQDTGNNSLASISATQTNGAQQTQIVQGGLTVGVKDLNTQVVPTDNGLIVNSVIHARTTGGGGGYVDVKANPSGALTVAASQDTTPWVVSGQSAVGSTPTNNPVSISGVDGGGLKRAFLTDIIGRLVSIAVPSDGYKATYSTAVTGLAAASLATDIFTLTGSASKIIRILRVEVSATQGSNGIRDILLIKRSTANSSGTSTNLTAVAHDSSSSSATATATAYTANPTIGTAVGTVRSSKLQIPATNLNTANTGLTWTFGDRPGQALLLRGTSELVAVNLNAATINGNSFNISIEWTEE